MVQRALSRLKEHELDSMAPTYKIKPHPSSYLIFTFALRFQYYRIPRSELVVKMRFSMERARENSSLESQQQASAPIEKEPGVVVVSGGSSARSEGGRSMLVPVKMKLISILLVSAIGFGSHWSSGVTGAMKSTLKKVRKQNTILPSRRVQLTRVATAHQQRTICGT